MNTPTSPETSAADVDPPWDPILVRDLVRQAQSTGHHPALLQLGHREAAAFRAFLSAAYGAEGTLTLKDTYYLGIEVVEIDAETHLSVGGSKQHDAWDGSLPPPWSDQATEAA
jgi:hypothetical protein